MPKYISSITWGPDGRPGDDVVFDDGYYFDDDSWEQTAEEQSSSGCWGVGVSGGGDSVALLCKIAELGFASSVVALHFNHQWSSWGDEAEAFVVQLCQKLNIKLVVGKPETRIKTGSAEAVARTQRLHFFAQQCRNLKLRGVMTAHTEDDDVETLLIRLARGSGIQGLLGMNSQDILNANPAGHPALPLRIVRPLIYANLRSQLRCYLTRIGQTWLEDPTNTDGSNLRGRIRNLWPAMEQAGFTREALQAVMHHLSRVDGLIEKSMSVLRANCILEDADNQIVISRPHLLESHKELQQRIIAEVIKELTGAAMAPRLPKRLDLLEAIRFLEQGTRTLGGVKWKWGEQGLIIAQPE